MATSLNYSRTGLKSQQVKSSHGFKTF